MTGLLALSRAIDRINGAIGRSAAWLLLAAVIVSAANAVIRKSFNISSNAYLELQWYLFGAVFMLCAAWTLREDEHVRVDVLSSFMSPRTRVWLDLVCHMLLLMCWCVAAAYFTSDRPAAAVLRLRHAVLDTRCAGPARLSGSRPVA